MRPRLLIAPILFFATLGSAQSAASFPPLEQWKAAVIARDAAALRSLYSSSPAAQVSTTSGKVDANTDAAFWTGLKARRFQWDIAESGSPQPGTWAIACQ